MAGIVKSIDEKIDTDGKPPEVQEQRYKLVNVCDYIESDPPPLRPVVENFFDRGDKVALIGKSKTKKTWCATQLALSLGSGQDFLHWLVPEKKRVLFVQLEVTGDHFHRRVKRCATELHIVPEELSDNIKVLNGRGLGIKENDIYNAAKEHRAEVVIIDPTYKLMDGDENGVEAWKPMLAEFDKICEELGAALVYVLHDKKGSVANSDSVDRGSGSGVVGRDYDSALLLSPHSSNADLVVFNTVKRNYPEEKAFCAKWENWLFSETSDVAEMGQSAKPKQTPIEDYIPRAKEVFQKDERHVFNKGESVRLIQSELELSDSRSKTLLEKMVQGGILFTNNGKGFKRKRIIYSLNEADIQAEIDQEIGVKKPKNNPCL